MKYIAIIDDDFLSNFRVDVRSNGQFSDMVLVVIDKAGSTRGIALKPLQRAMVVTEEGNSAYLRQEHIDCLIEMERKEMFEEAVRDMMKSLGLEENHANNQRED